jgi:hypothetical protein
MRLEVEMRVEDMIKEIWRIGDRSEIRLSFIWNRRFISAIESLGKSLRISRDEGRSE